MEKVTVSTISTVFALLLGLVPISAEQIQEFLPYIQVAAYTATAANHSFQIARNLKRSKQ